MYNDLWIVSCVLLVLGALCAAAGTAFKYYGMREDDYPGHAEAEVVDIIPVARTDRSVFSEFSNRQAAVFQFYADGKLRKVVDTSEVYPCPYKLNQRVKICYDPADPERYSIPVTNKWKRMGSILSTAGPAALCAGCLLYLFYASGIEL